MNSIKDNLSDEFLVHFDGLCAYPTIVHSCVHGAVSMFLEWASMGVVTC